MRCRAADRTDVTAPLAPPLAALAVPDKGGGLAVPGLGSLLEPCADLGGRLGMLARQGPALEDALDGLGHVQPTTAERGIERHDAVLAQPQHHVGLEPAMRDRIGAGGDRLSGHRPVAGWNRVRILVVPPRTYSCGCVAGWPCGRQLLPECGTAWNGPASSSHHTGRPRSAPCV